MKRFSLLLCIHSFDSFVEQRSRWITFAWKRKKNRKRKTMKYKILCNHIVFVSTHTISGSKKWHLHYNCMNVWCVYILLDVRIFTKRRKKNRVVYKTFNGRDFSLSRITNDVCFHFIFPHSRTNQQSYYIIVCLVSFFSVHEKTFSVCSTTITYAPMRMYCLFDCTRYECGHVCIVHVYRSAPDNGRDMQYKLVWNS